MPRINEDVAALSYEDIIELYAEHGGERAAAKHLGVPRTTLQDHFRRLKEDRFRAKKSKEAFNYDPTDEVQVFILSSAQDSTKVDSAFLHNLEAYADYRNAKIMISGFTYNKTLFEDHDKHHSWYPREIEPYLVQQRINIGPRLTFCGEMNTLPTAVNPLSGFETYTRDRWGIFPHPKVHLKSIPTAKDDLVKIIMTTGTMSLPNYVQKKAGIKAEFNHEVGAVVVELLPNGEFFCRHLLAEDDGSFQDLTTRVDKGMVTEGHAVEAVNWGDIHHEKEDPVISGACWGVQDPMFGRDDFEPMIDKLRPSFQFMHDIIDFEPRNHHNIKDPHFRFLMHKKNAENVEDALNSAADFLAHADRDYCQTVVVESNHDLALLKWLKTADYREDPVNALYFLTLQKKIYEEMEAGNSEFSVLPWALEQQNDLSEILFLNEDDSFIIAGGIECALHGHNGANGSRANAAQFARMGKRSNTGHTHSAAILDGNYCAGVTGSLDMGYNKGLSSWSHSHIVTYPSGKRTIVTQLANGLYCADVL